MKLSLKLAPARSLMRRARRIEDGGDAAGVEGGAIERVAGQFGELGEGTDGVGQFGEATSNSMGDGHEPDEGWNRINPWNLG